MADVVLSLVLAKVPHISPYGVLFGVILFMGLGLVIAIKWPRMVRKDNAHVVPITLGGPLLARHDRWPPRLEPL